MSKYRTQTQAFSSAFVSIVDDATGITKAHGVDKQFAEQILNALEFYDTVKQAFSRAESPNSTISQTVTSSLLDKLLFDSRYLVASSWIQSIGYAASTLRIYKFNGNTITHTNVPPTVFRRLIHSDSVGQAYNELVKGQYPSV